VQNNKILNIGDINLPDEEAKRQAIASLRGYAYQLHQTASEWINLQDNEILYLEIAEDYAKVIKSKFEDKSTLLATQVKDTYDSGNITLNTTAVRDIIQKLYDLKHNNQDKNIRCNFLTTSEIGLEKNNKLPNNEKGIWVWNNVNDKNIENLRSFLLKSSFDTKFNDFIQKSTDKELQDFVKSLSFIYTAPDIKELENENIKTLNNIRSLVDATPESAEKAYVHIVYNVLDTIINSNDRKLTKSDFIACFRKATTIPVPSQIVEDLLKERPQNQLEQIDKKQLLELAEKLLNNSLPSDLSLLFADITIEVRDAHKILTECERHFVECSFDEKKSIKRCLPIEILNNKDRKHIYYAGPGSGKTYTLWKIAKRLLDEGELIPLFLPIGNLNTWDEVLSIISDICPEIDPQVAINQSKICLCLDGWSEFAVGKHSTERIRAARMMNNAYVIANARYEDSLDNQFHRWSLENIEQSLVTQVLKVSNIPAPENILDLLQIPLTLLLFIFLGGGASTGELLHKFHNHLIYNKFPEKFEYALNKAVSSMILSNDHNYLNFETELKKYAKESELYDSVKLLKQLGTIKERSGQILPIHDLYWSWLGGIGIFQNNKLEECIIDLKTRESIELALETGEKASIETTNKIVPIDIFLATKLNKQNSSNLVDKQLDNMLKHKRLAVRYRAAISSISSGKKKYIQKSLSVISEMCGNKIFTSEMHFAFKPDMLFSCKEELENWVGAPGTDLVIDSIIESGKQEWLPWLEKIIKKENINISQVVAAALACSSYIPEWCYFHLNEFIKSKSYKLRDIKKRGENTALVSWLLENYEKIVIPNSSNWCHINEYLEACATEDDFEKLFQNFPSMNPQAQDLIAYAVVSRGEPWINKFQRIAFSKEASKHHHKLKETLSLEIDDETARQWIQNGYEKQGWRVLVTRHQNDIIPELIERLPDSFSGLHYIPTLSAMEYLENAPANLIDEIFSRFKGAMQPMAAEDALIAISRVRPQGIASIVKWIVDNPSLLPAYHIKRVMELYLKWAAEYKINFMLKTKNSNFSFKDHLIYSTFRFHQDDHFFAEILSYNPEFIIELVFTEYANDDVKAKNILSKLQSITNFDSRLFDKMISSKILAPLIPQVFANAFELFPVEYLQQILDSQYIKYEDIMWKLSKTSNINHIVLHTKARKQGVI
jgi:hypothetical protein